MLMWQYERKKYFFENFQNLRGPTKNSIFPIVTWWGGLKKCRRTPKPKRNFLYSHYRCCYPKTKVFSLPELNFSEKAFSRIYHMENIMGGRWDPLNFENFQKNIFSFNIVPKGTTIHVGRSTFLKKNYFEPPYIIGQVYEPRLFFGIRDDCVYASHRLKE